MSSAPREYSRRPPGVDTSCTPDAVPLPFRNEGGVVERRQVRRFQRMRQHRRPEHGRPGGIGARPPALDPGEQRVVGRRQPVPDLLDVVGGDGAAAELGECHLGQPDRGADTQRAGDQLQDRQPHRGGRGVEPAGDQTRQLGLGRHGQRLDHLGQQRRRRVRPPLRPHQRHRLGQVADVVVRPGEQHRVGALLRQGADQAGLGGIEGELAGECCEADAAIGVRFGLEEAAQQRHLGQPARGQGQPLQQLGEGDHAAASAGSGDTAGGPSSPSSSSP